MLYSVISLHTMHYCTQLGLPVVLYYTISLYATAQRLLAELSTLYRTTWLKNAVNCSRNIRLLSLQQSLSLGSPSRSDHNPLPQPLIEFFLLPPASLNLLTLQTAPFSWHMTSAFKFTSDINVTFNRTSLQLDVYKHQPKTGQRHMKYRYISKIIMGNWRTLVEYYVKNETFKRRGKSTQLR